MTKKKLFTMDSWTPTKKKKKKSFSQAMKTARIIGKEKNKENIREAKILHREVKDISIETQKEIASYDNGEGPRAFMDPELKRHLRIIIDRQLHIEAKLDRVLRQLGIAKPQKVMYDTSRDKQVKPQKSFSIRKDKS